MARIDDVILGDESHLAQHCTHLAGDMPWLYSCTCKGKALWHQDRRGAVAERHCKKDKPFRITLGSRANISICRAIRDQGSHSVSTPAYQPEKDKLAKTKKRRHPRILNQARNSIGRDFVKLRTQRP